MQVVRAEHQRPVQREFLGQVGERVHGAELQAGVASHGDRAAVPAVPGGQQLRDRRPPRLVQHVLEQPRLADAGLTAAQVPVRSRAHPPLGAPTEEGMRR